MMRVVCEQCGTANSVDEHALLAGAAVCRRCAARLSADAGDVTAGAPPPQLEPAGGGHAWLAALEDPGDFDLGAMADGPAPVASAPPPPAEAPKGLTGAFRFGADDEALDEATRLDGGAGPVDFDRRANPTDQESTRVVAAPGQRPMARPSVQAAWRIKGERGLVYEMQSVNAVVAWLEGKRQIRSIQIAKGEGPFRPVDQYPEVEARLQKRPEPDKPKAKGARGRAADEPLTLDLSTQPKRTSEATTRPARPAEAEAARAPRTREAATARAPVEVEATSGFGVVLAAVVGSLALSVGLVAAGVLLADLAPPVAPPPSAPVPPPAPRGALAKAIAEYEAGHNTAATKILEGLRGGDDPRVDRYLALVLHRTGRDREARAALARYRVAMQRVNGEHGRQVREVRD